MPRPSLAWGVLGLLGALAGPAAIAADFNGDGFSDLVIGSANASVSGEIGPGNLHVVYGQTGTGLGSTGMQVIAPGSIVAPGVVLEGVGGFGLSVIGLDFDGDGIDDLAASLPFASVHGIPEAGAVALFRGTAGGLVPHGVLHQDQKGVKDKCEAKEEFGRALAAGDFDGDGRDDLAVGVGETVKGQLRAGAVHVFYGAKKGPSGQRDRLFHQNRPGLNGEVEAFDLFGSELASGDLNGDGRDDLAIAVPGEIRTHGEQDELTYVGAVAVLFGRAHGLSTKKDLLFDAFDVGDTNPALQQPGDFGSTMVTGDFDGDGRADLAISASSHGAPTGVPRGRVYALRGAKQGLDFENPFAHSLVTTNSMLFGLALAAADFDADGRDDLAVGAPLTDLDGSGGPVIDAGMVVVHRGTASGLSVQGISLFSQSTIAFVGTPEPMDFFGTTLAAGDFDGNGAADLAIGVPFDDISGTNAGAVNVVRGNASTGLSNTNAQIWTETALGALSQPSEVFGITLGS